MNEDIPVLLRSYYLKPFIIHHNVPTYTETPRISQSNTYLKNNITISEKHREANIEHE